MRETTKKTHGGCTIHRKTSNTHRVRAKSNVQVYLIALHKYNQTFWVPTIYIARSQNVRPSPTKKKNVRSSTYKTFHLISWFKGTCDREIVDDKAEKCVGVEGLLFLLKFKSSCKRIMVLTFPMLDYDKVCAKYYLMW